MIYKVPVVLPKDALLYPLDKFMSLIAKDEIYVEAGIIRAVLIDNMLTNLTIRGWMDGNAHSYEMTFDNLKHVTGEVTIYWCPK